MKLIRKKKSKGKKGKTIVLAMTKNKKSMNGIQNLVRFVALSAFLAISIYCLFWVCMGTTHTNINSLSSKFDDPNLVYGISLAITMGFTLAFFLSKRGFGVTLIVYIIMSISSALAINTMSQKEIVGAEQRRKTDSRYNTAKERYDDLMKSYRSNQAILDKYAENEWDPGARDLRLQNKDIQADAQAAFAEMKSREAALDTMGTVTNEAFVETWLFLAQKLRVPVLRGMDAKAITILSNVLFSIINDALIPIFVLIIRSILGSMVLIPVIAQNSWIDGWKTFLFTGKFPRFLKSGNGFHNSENNVNLGNGFHNSGNRLVNKRGQNSRGRPVSKETVSNIREICLLNSVNKEGNHGWTYDDIGEKAAKNLGRGDAFSKGYVCKALKRAKDFNL